MLPEETINVLLAVIAFGVLHSLMAAVNIKALFVTLMGRRGYLGLYRLFYNAVSVITFLPVLMIAAADPGENIWKTDGMVAISLRIIQLIGLVGLIISLIQIDTWQFIGIKQAMAYVSGEPLPLPPEPLSTAGVYRIVRHPLYLFSLMVIWALPVMSAASFGLAIGAAIYFILGSILEERKLSKIFGEAYTQYQREVPWMIPFLNWLIKTP